MVLRRALALAPFRGEVWPDAQVRCRSTLTAHSGRYRIRKPVNTFRSPGPYRDPAPTFRDANRHVPKHARRTKEDHSNAV